MRRRRPPQPPALLALAVALAVACCCPLPAALATPPACRPQGLLRLSQPYLHPQRVSLPFCSDYGCSCCNSSHALTIQRSLRRVLLDEDLSQPCREGLVMLGCRVCDPQVGVGNATVVCEATCQEVFDACAQDYFMYDESSGLIAPCSDEHSGMLVCSQLSELAKGGAEFCAVAGHPVTGTADGLALPCFDGSPKGPEACAGQPPPPPAQQQPRRRAPAAKATSSSWPWPWKLIRKQRRQLAAAGQVLLGLLVSGGVSLGIVLLLQRLLKPRPRPQANRPVTSVSDMLAKAAEARAAGGGRGGVAASSQQQQQQHSGRPKQQ